MSNISSSISLTDEKDIIYSGFKLHKNGLQAIGTPSFEQWQECGDFIKKSNGAVHFWIGDWLNYGERAWGEMYSQELQEETGFEYETLRKDKYISKEIPFGMRTPNLTPTHANILAPMKQEEKEYWANEIAKEPMPVRELKEKIKAKKKLELGTPQLPNGKFDVIYADPPWDVQAGPDWGSSGPSKDLAYPTMTLEEITSLPVEDLAADNAHLYIWTINKYIPETYDIARAWGFEPSCLITWAKPPHGIGLGGTFVQTTEHLLFCRKGTLEATKRIDTTWFEYPRGRHSEKPDEFRKMIEEVSPGKRLELFAREKVRDWEVWGNQI